jgi:ABC-type xylose transport system permease subunit
MSDMDPRTWSRQYQIALALAIVIGMVLGGVVGLTASEIQPPAFIEYDTSISD